MKTRMAERGNWIAAFCATAVLCACRAPAKSAECLAPSAASAAIEPSPPSAPIELAKVAPATPSAPSATPAAAVAPVSPSPQPAAQPAPQIAALPVSVDLREQLLAWKLPPRPQGARGTCSIFTTCESIEFALARATGEPKRLSPEFVNWSGAQVIGRPSDGNFFHNALAGFERFGVCSEESLPYREPFDPNLAPPQTALDEAAALRDATKTSLVVHWIVPWQAARFGITDEQLKEIQRVLATGYPVAAGSGHSRLLVGYKDDAAREGGGVFVTEDSALNRFDEVTYDFVKKQICDVFWIEGLPSK